MDMLRFLEDLQIKSGSEGFGGIAKDRYCKFGTNYTNKYGDVCNGELKVYQNGRLELTFSDDYAPLDIDEQETRYYSRVEAAFSKTHSDIEFDRVKNIVKAYDTYVEMYGEGSDKVKDFKDRYEKAFAEYSTTNQAQINEFMNDCDKHQEVTKIKESDDHISHLNLNEPLYYNINKDRRNFFVHDNKQILESKSIEVELHDVVKRPEGDVLHVTPKTDYRIKAVLRNNPEIPATVCISKNDDKYIDAKEILNESIYPIANEGGPFKLKLNDIKNKIDSEEENKSPELGE